MTENVEIRSGVELPSNREPVTLITADGLSLIGELALPPDKPPVATLITLHPLPTHGGFMDSHILRKAANRLPYLADLAVLRFNTRGTTSPRGTSQGSFGEGITEIRAREMVRELRGEEHRQRAGRLPAVRRPHRRDAVRPRRRDARANPQETLDHRETVER